MNIDEVIENITNSPKLTYGLIISVLTLVLIGYVRKWKWATDPTGNRDSVQLVEWLGYENYRKIMIVALIVVILILFLLFLNT
ncbi:Imm17 family immunity protein [Flavobacterium ardleyense]|uniref:Imm17 family immunity protein n=1 Tax=Flavobacterium ardleyense TaxID=2038737 RepID=A0ABW5ZB57_9FLAO